MRRQSKTGAAAIKARLRANTELELRAQGMSYVAIARELGLDESTCRKRVKQELAKLKAIGEENAEELRQIESQRLDAIVAGMWEKATVLGDHNAANTIIKAIDSRMRLMGHAKMPGDVGDVMVNGIRFVRATPEVPAHAVVPVDTES